MSADTNPAPSRAGIPNRDRRWLIAIAMIAALAIVGATAPLPWLHYLSKPAATLLVFAMVWTMPATAPGYRRAILAGLALSTLGDVFLMLPGDWCSAWAVSCARTWPTWPR
jgi:uncharacterized membrane protein YhhN